MRRHLVTRSRVAALDCGTNSLRLLIADLDGDQLHDVVRRMEIVRLGEGVDRTGRLSEAALGRTFRALDEYAAQIAEHQVESVRLVATSATRDASNRETFAAGVQDRIGVPPDVVTGDEEAQLSFTGATRELRGTSVEKPYLVVDIGGGSTEFIVGADDLDAARSVDVGCVRLTERHFADDPPASSQVEAALADIDRALALVEDTVPVGEARTLIGLAGTVTTVAAIAAGLPEYDAEQIHRRSVSREQVRDVTSLLLHIDRDERAAIPVMHPGRVDVIAAGGLVLQRIMERFDFSSLIASEHDILDGIAMSIA